MDVSAIVHAKDSDHCVATWNQTFIQIWRFASTPAAIVEMNQLARVFVAEQPTPRTSLFIVEPTSAVPNAKARDELGIFSRDIVPQMSIAVVVPEGGGFRGSLVRGVGTALVAMMGARLPYTFAENVEQGVGLLAPHLPEGASPEALVRAIVELRATL